MREHGAIRQKCPKTDTGSKSLHYLFYTRCLFYTLCFIHLPTLYVFQACWFAYQLLEYGLFFFNRSLLEYNFFTILCQFLLYTKVNQPYAYIDPHIPSLLSLPPTLPIPPLQVIAEHRADLPVLRCCFPLANYFTFGSVYTSMLLNITHYQYVLLWKKNM